MNRGERVSAQHQKDPVWPRSRASSRNADPCASRCCASLSSASAQRNPQRRDSPQRRRDLGDTLRQIRRLQSLPTAIRLGPSRSAGLWPVLSDARGSSADRRPPTAARRDDSSSRIASSASSQRRLNESSASDSSTIRNPGGRPASTGCILRMRPAKACNVSIAAWSSCSAAAANSAERCRIGR